MLRLYSSYVRGPTGAATKVAAIVCVSKEDCNMERVSPLAGVTNFQP